MKISQKELAKTLVHDLHAVDARADAVSRSASSVVLNWKPASGGWSAAQIFEHLCVANDSYLVVIRRLLAGAAPNVAQNQESVVWRPSLVGGILARSMESPRKLPAPKQWHPVPEPRHDVIAEFLDRQREIVQLMEHSSPYEWRRVRLASPVSMFIRMNLGDAFTIMVRHAERHMGQIERRLAEYQAARADRVPAHA